MLEVETLLTFISCVMWMRCFTPLIPCSPAVSEGNNSHFPGLL